jgi:hypothetical protein
LVILFKREQTKEGGQAMNFTRKKLFDLVLTLSVTSSGKEVSGYYTPSGAVRSSFGSRTIAPFVDRPVSFHTHVNSMDCLSSQDAVAFMGARRTRLHVLVTPNKVIILRKARKARHRLVLGAMGYCFAPRAVWEKTWKAPFDLMGYDVIEHPKKDFVNP